MELFCSLGGYAREFFRRGYQGYRQVLVAGDEAKRRAAFGEEALAAAREIGDGPLVVVGSLGQDLDEDFMQVAEAIAKLQPARPAFAGANASAHPLAIRAGQGVVLVVRRADGRT